MPENWKEHIWQMQMSRAQRWFLFALNKRRNSCSPSRRLFIWIEGW